SVYEKLKAMRVTYRNGKPFLKTAITYILQNPVYIGKVKYAGKTTQGIHQPIISEEVFGQAQKIHKDKKRTMKLYKNFALAGLIRCKECDSHMTPCYTNKRNGRKLKRYYYYRCTDTFKREWGSCTTKQVSADRLEDYIFGNLERISLDKQYLDSLCFSLNHQAKEGRIGFRDGSKNPAKNPSAGHRSGLEQLKEPPKISPEIFAQTLAVLTKSFSEKKGMEKNLLAKKFIQSIQYSKNSIKLNLFSPLPNSSSISSGKEKIRSKGAKNSKNLVRNERNGCPAWARTRQVCVVKPNIQKANFPAVDLTNVVARPGLEPGKFAPSNQTFRKQTSLPLV
ncbi:MAG: recombinase family protein, partial [Candidatus Omnitrophota bacterium]